MNIIKQIIVLTGIILVAYSVSVADWPTGRYDYYAMQEQQKPLQPIWRLPGPGSHHNRHGNRGTALRAGVSIKRQQ